MYYELYIDKFFLENMILDYLLLSLVSRALKCQTNWRRLLLASMLGAAGMCVLVILPIQNTWIYNICGFGILSILITKAGCRIKGKGNLLRGILLLYLSAFLLGGIWEMLFGHIALENLLLGMASYLTLRLMLYFYHNLREKTEYFYEVEIGVCNKSKGFIGLCDTGNRLKQPLTGKPVIIISYDDICQLLDTEIKGQIGQMYQFQNGEYITDKVSYIPYHSIGERNGLLPGIRLDYVKIQGSGGSRFIKGAIAAVTKESVSSKGEYQVIFPPSILED